MVDSHYSNVEIATLLSKVNLFSELKDAPDALRALATIMTIETFPLGHKLIQEGTSGDNLFILIKGQVSVFKNTPDGDSYKVVILKSDITPALGEGGLVESEPRSATVICDTESQCFVLTRDSFLKFSANHPQWVVPILQRIASTLIGRLRQTSNDLMLLHKALMDEIRN